MTINSDNVGWSKYEASISKMEGASELFTVGDKGQIYKTNTDGSIVPWQSLTTSEKNTVKQAVQYNLGQLKEYNPNPVNQHVVSQTVMATPQKTASTHAAFARGQASLDHPSAAINAVAESNRNLLMMLQTKPLPVQYLVASVRLLVSQREVLVAMIGQKKENELPSDLKACITQFNEFQKVIAGHHNAALKTLQDSNKQLVQLLQKPDIPAQDLAASKKLLNAQRELLLAITGKKELDKASTDPYISQFHEFQKIVDAQELKAKQHVSTPKSQESRIRPDLSIKIPRRSDSSDSGSSGTPSSISTSSTPSTPISANARSQGFQETESPKSVDRTQVDVMKSFDAAVKNGTKMVLQYLERGQRDKAVDFMKQLQEHNSAVAVNILDNIKMSDMSKNRLEKSLFILESNPRRKLEKPVTPKTPPPSPASRQEPIKDEVFGLTSPQRKLLLPFMAAGPRFISLADNDVEEIRKGLTSLITLPSNHPRQKTIQNIVRNFLDLEVNKNTKIALLQKMSAADPNFKAQLEEYTKKNGIRLPRF